MDIISNKFNEIKTKADNIQASVQTSLNDMYKKIYDWLSERGFEYTKNKLSLSELPDYKTQHTKILLAFTEKMGIPTPSSTAVLIVQLGLGIDVKKYDIAKTCDDEIYTLLNDNDGILILED
ncbi:hypothetical protein [Treponema sp.]|uniref:hypothetical protein n=1 Tax=Treponema sp. TaxID=166 RepID=UPI00298DF699|nr:hypothetical protein [Treponema sp.]MCQ2240138.1 hypothetical protein [Treponema sp.]